LFFGTLLHFGDMLEPYHLVLTISFLIPWNLGNLGIFFSKKILCASWNTIFFIAKWQKFGTKGNHKKMTWTLNLGFVLLQITNDNELVKKWVDFVKINFHLNENIDWICIMQLELNSNFIEHYSPLIWFNKVNVPIDISIELNLGELNQIK
jgi:hypothetical protein